jgi:hypothetical protein
MKPIRLGPLTEANVIEGRCLCKKVQFRVTTPTLTCSHCHCESCRRAHSALFVTWTSFNIDQLSFICGKDLLTKFESSKGHFRSFCSSCGTRLLAETAEEYPVVYIPTACFSSEIDLKATCHVSFEEKVDWLEITDPLPKYKSKTELIQRLVDDDLRESAGPKGTGPHGA